MALLEKVLVWTSPNFLAASRRILLSPIPGGWVKSQIWCNGTAFKKVAKSSSKNGNLASREWLLNNRSSLPELLSTWSKYIPKFLFHSLPKSSSNSSCKSSQLPLLNVVLCLPYPASCSSAPKPSNSILAGDSYSSLTLLFSRVSLEHKMPWHWAVISYCYLCL